MFSSTPTPNLIILETDAAPDTLLGELAPLAAVAALSGRVPRALSEWLTQAHVHGTLADVRLHSDGHGVDSAQGTLVEAGFAPVGDAGEHAGRNHASTPNAVQQGGTREGGSLLMIANAGGGSASPWILIPQILFSILAYPIAARLVGAVDRFRLIPVRAV